MTPTTGVCNDGVIRYSRSDGFCKASVCRVFEWKGQDVVEQAAAKAPLILNLTPIGAIGVLVNKLN